MSIKYATIFSDNADVLCVNSYHFKGSVQRRLRWVKNSTNVGYWPGTTALEIFFVIK
jgi:hypothetical protein